MKTFILSIVAGCLFFNPVMADHEPDHRYNIRGYVLNAAQQGVASLAVVASADGEILETGKTDANGYYSLHLHLHNPDLGRAIKLRAGQHEAELRVTFDPNDLTSSRVHDANFVAGKFVEGEIGHFRIPPWSYALAGLLVIFTIAVLLERRRKRKIRLARAVGGAKLSPAGHRVKKPRRKKH